MSPPFKSRLQPLRVSLCILEGYELPATALVQYIYWAWDVDFTCVAQG